MLNTREYTHICYYFFWHLPPVTFINGFSCVYMYVSKEIRPKIKAKKKKKTNIHKHFKQTEKFS